MQTKIEGIEHAENRQKANDIRIVLYKHGPTVITWEDGRSLVTTDSVKSIRLFPDKEAIFEHITVEIGKDTYTCLSLNGTYARLLAEYFQIF